MKAQWIKRIVAMAVLVLMPFETERVQANFLCSPPVKVPNINNGNGNLGGSISSDGLELYFASERGGNFDLYVSARPSVQSEWSAPVRLGPPVNSSYWEHVPSISPDGLSLYFSSDRPGGSGGLDIWVSTRSTPGEPWGQPVNLGPTINSPVWDPTARVSADGLKLLFHSERAGGLGREDVWMATRTSKEDPWGTPVNLGAPVNSSYNDGEAVLSADGLALFFNSDRAGGSGNYDLWVTTRRKTSDPWGPPVNLGPSVNSPNVDWCGSLSADGSTLYFCSDRPKTWDWCNIYQTTITPVVDLNGDEIVDSADVAILIEHWQTDDPLCDIGPMPWGDGIVDVQDLIVLSAHLFEKVLPAELIAYWMLDETVGDVAHDSAGKSHAAVVGSPIWRPACGQVDGALELDGVDDSVVAGSILNPADGPFSIFVWVKNGAPGQTVVCESHGADWLAIDPKGCLMTGLATLGRSMGPLLSGTVITDTRWHHIGLVWDGSYRHLYVDGVEAAMDTAKQARMKGAYGDLCFGAGGTLAPGTFFTGLLDDIRIYNKALSAWEIEALLQ